MADRQNRPAATPRVDIDQTEASTLERRRALRAAEREFEGQWANVEGGEYHIKMLAKVEEHPDFHIDFEVVEVEPPESLIAFFVPLLPPWWRFMRILIKGRKTRSWQERIAIDDLGEAETRVIKGDPEGRFTYGPSPE